MLFELFPKSQKTETQAFTTANGKITDDAEVISLYQLTPNSSICTWSVDNKSSHKPFCFTVCAMSPLASRGHLRDTVEGAALVSANCVVEWVSIVEIRTFGEGICR